VSDLPAKTSVFSAPHGKTILVVDDVVEVLDLVAAILGDLGYEIVCACDGQRALQILGDGRRFDLLFTDIMMPGVHGFELARRAKALQPSLKIIYLTGYAAISPDDVGETFGPILKKPFRAKDLEAAVQQEMGD
jgi:CheY-like chemotaxis protein